MKEIIDNLNTAILEKNQLISELKEENLNLKNELEYKKMWSENHSKEIRELKESFVEAREIIEGLMRFCRCFAQHHTEDIRYKDAEQFLYGDKM